MNTAGDGAESDESASVTLVGKPPKPTNVTVSGGDASVTLGWTSGGNGGSAITKWQYLKEDDGTWDGTWTDICETSTNSNCPSVASHTVSNLTNGTAYKFKVRAVNTHGDGAESDESASVTPATKPSKPTSVTVSSGDASVTLGWTSGGNSGSEITKWQYLKEDDGTWDSTWTDICDTESDSNCPSTTSHTVSDLTNGTPYKFKVRAVNELGDGAESDESASVTPEGKPFKPTNVTASRGDQSVTLGWASGGNGGSEITKWQYRRKADATWDSTWMDICKTESDSDCPSTTSHTVSSLNNGTTYKFKVRAANTHGDGAQSDESRLRHSRRQAAEARDADGRGGTPERRHLVVDYVEQRFGRHRLAIQEEDRRHLGQRLDRRPEQRQPHEHDRHRRQPDQTTRRIGSRCRRRTASARARNRTSPTQPLRRLPRWR